MSGEDIPTNFVSTFPYPGSKGRESDWIVSRIPAHDCYVEVFGGSGAILYNKPPSHNEVFNDLNDDIVQFFEVMRDRTEDLEEWVRSVPYARSVYEEWAEAYCDGCRPDDPVERAGRFFALRYMQWAGRIDTVAGFKTRNKWSPSRSWDNARQRLEELASRFDTVIIENRDWRQILDGYDAAWDDPNAQDVVFYLDPPYLEGEHYYEGGVDHGELVDALGSVEGRWMVSYTDLPDGLEEYHVLERGRRHQMTRGGSDATERLVCNFDPTLEASFIGDGHRQEKLALVADVRSDGGGD